MKERKFELNEDTLSVIEQIGGHMPGGFFIYRADAREELIYANKAVYDIYGCSGPEEFKSLTGYTFRGMVHPDDYDRISSSIIHQISTSHEKMDYAEYRIVRKDGTVRWVDDYGHFAETRAYGGVYVVFISDITGKKLQRETDAATRDAVISTLTTAYNTVYLINDVVTEQMSLYHSDMDQVHEEAIRNALSHARYTDTKTEYVNTMIAEEDRERMQEQMVLSMREIEVEHAENGRIAVEMYASHAPGYYDAILMDMRMPEMDGLEASRLIRATDRADAKTIPIIALTANAFDEDVQRSMQAGLNAHLSKPVEPEALFRTLESLMQV